MLISFRIKISYHFSHLQKAIERFFNAVQLTLDILVETTKVNCYKKQLTTTLAIYSEILQLLKTNRYLPSQSRGSRETHKAASKTDSNSCRIAPCEYRQWLYKLLRIKTSVTEIWLCQEAFLWKTRVGIARGRRAFVLKKFCQSVIVVST